MSLPRLRTFPGVEEIFERKGILSNALPGFEYRRGQLEMAISVRDALMSKSTIMVEAGTGIGKSLAYLVPLVGWITEPPRKGKAIVSTYTKALQRQLVEKELPFIRDQLCAPGLRYAISFGSENYLCRRRLEKALQRGLFDDQDGAHLPALLDWVKTTAEGLKGELSVGGRVWQKVCREPEACQGRRCRFFRECFFQTARAEERKAEIIVTNHHLFFANIAADALPPDIACVVLDEAHEIEDVASDHFCLEASHQRLRYVLDSILAKKGRGVIMAMRWLKAQRRMQIAGLVEGCAEHGDRLFGDVRARIGERRSVRLPDGLDGEDALDGRLESLHLALRGLAEEAEDEEDRIDLETAAWRVHAYANALEGIRNDATGDHVCWASLEEGDVRVVLSPLDVSGALRTQVFTRFRPLVMTSATLAVNGSFDFMKGRLGLEDAPAFLFPSPFDYGNQALLYLPASMPDPNGQGYAEAVATQVMELVNIIGGRTMVLFTSYALLEEVAGLVGHFHRVLRQGELGISTLLDEFRRETAPVLFGTYTFWQGIDLPGDYLRCVIIARLPFAAPSEPVTEARLQAMASEGIDPFPSYQVPRAAVLFRQGFGRLIRSGHDRGVVAVLDPRILRKSYGRAFLDSIPASGVTGDLERVRTFLAADSACG